MLRVDQNVEILAGDDAGDEEEKRTAFLMPFGAELAGGFAGVVSPVRQMRRVQFLISYAVWDGDFDEMLVGRHWAGAAGEFFQNCCGIMLAGVDHRGFCGVPTARKQGRAGRIKD